MKRRPLLKWSICLAAALFASCQPFYAPLTHSTPCFTNARQVELSAGLGFISTSASIAFSPVKYMSVQASGFRYTDVNDSPHFTDYGEVGLGAYYPYETGVVGFNIGYGYGFANWQAKSLNFGSLSYAEYVSRKTFGQFYIGFKIGEEGKSYTGCSFKLNQFNNLFYAANTSNGVTVAKSDLPVKAQSFELSYFLKQSISRRFYFDMSAGLALASRYSSGIFRFGISARIGRVK